MATNGNGHDKDTSSAAAFVIRVAGQAGPRAIEVTFGVPLDMTVNDLNQYVDKVCMVIDRQTDRGELGKIKADLEGASKALLSHLEHRAAFERAARESWERSGRRGEFKMHDSQLAQIGNFDKTISELRDTRIPGFQKRIDELERSLKAEV